MEDVKESGNRLVVIAEGGEKNKTFVGMRFFCDKSLQNDGTKPEHSS